MARKSDWLVAAQAKDPAVKPCKSCKGTGTTGTQQCPDCGGFGY